MHSARNFDELAPLSEDEMPVSSHDLNLDLIFQGCDPPDIQPPAQIIEGLLTDALVPEADWGTETTESRRKVSHLDWTASETSTSGAPPSLRKKLAGDAVCEVIRDERVIDFNALDVKLISTRCSDGRYTFRMEPLGSKEGNPPESVDDSCDCSIATGNGVHAAMDDAFEASGDLKTKFNMACCLRKLVPEFMSEQVRTLFEIRTVLESLLGSPTIPAFV